MKCPKCNSERAIGSGGISSKEIRDGLHCPDCGYSYEHVEKINKNSQTPSYTPPAMPEVKPPKQHTVLSVRDFAILYNIINDKIRHMESQAQWTPSYLFNQEPTEAKKASYIEENMERLRQHLDYQDLLRIRDKLGELNIEIETPRVEVE